MSLIIWPSKKYYELVITALFLSWESFLLKSIYPVKIRTWTPSYLVCFWLVFFFFPLIVWILYICIENRLKLWNKLSQFINKKFVDLLSNQTLTGILDGFLWCQKKNWCPIIYSIIIFLPQILLLLSHSLVSDSMRPDDLLQYSRHPCPSPSPRACSNSCPLNQWCHSIILFSSSPIFNLSKHQGIF